MTLICIDTHQIQEVVVVGETMRPTTIPLAFDGHRFFHFLFIHCDENGNDATTVWQMESNFTQRGRTDPVLSGWLIPAAFFFLSLS